MYQQRNLPNTDVMNAPVEEATICWYGLMRNLGSSKSMFDDTLPSLFIVECLSHTRFKKPAPYDTKSSKGDSENESSSTRYIAGTKRKPHT